MVTTLFPRLSTATWQRSTRSDLHAQDAATRTVLISITRDSHRTGSVAGKEVVRTLFQAHIKVDLANPRSGIYNVLKKTHLYLKKIIWLVKTETGESRRYV